MREIFLHESAMLESFGNQAFAFPITWNNSVVADNFWHPQLKLGTNLSLQTRFTPNLKFDGILLKMSQIHPAFLEPAIIVVVEQSTGTVLWFELLNGEMLSTKDFPVALKRIEQLAESIGLNSQVLRSFKWWRLFAMFDRLFFLASSESFDVSCAALRQRAMLPASLTGECQTLISSGRMIGIDGWFDLPTGFGIGANV